MKFDKPKVHRQWTSEETQARITLVNSEISSFCRDLNLLDREMNTLRHRKESIQKKISNKAKYVNQLENQLDEISINNAKIDLETFLIENLGPYMTRAHNDATEPDIADDLRESSEDWTYPFSWDPDTHSIVYTPYIPLLVTPPLISGSGLPSNIPNDEKDWDSEPDIADELRPWSASSRLSSYFRVVQPKYPNIIPTESSEFIDKFSSLTTNDGFIPTTPKYFEGDVNPTGSNSFGFNVQPLKLESSDITPEIGIRIATATVDTVIKALKDLGV